MKALRAIVTLAILIVAGAFAGAGNASAVLDNGTGHYWLFDGANRTGQYRDFNIGPSQTVNLGTLSYQQNCGGSCHAMKNTVSSVAFSCGTTGSPIDQNDTITFYDIFPNIGTHQLVDPNYPGACVNGLITVNLTTANNLADSLITHE